MQLDGWKLDGYRGHFQLSHAQGACDVLQPDLGVTGLAIDGSSLPRVSLLGPTLPRPVGDRDRNDVETYTRCGDLVAIYAPTASYPFRSQCYWRVGSHPLEVGGFPAGAAIELVASQQTDLLDSDPRLTVCSSISAEEIFCLDRERAFKRLDLSALPRRFSKEDFSGCVLYRVSGVPLSYVEIVHPLDFEATSLSHTTTQEGALVRAEHVIFARRLEKGVILRSRVLGLWLPREEDERGAIAHYQAFAASEPPLTN